MVTLQFHATLATWVALFVVLIGINAFVILRVAVPGINSKELGQVVTGGTVILVTTIRYALCPISHCFREYVRGFWQDRSSKEGQGEEKESNENAHEGEDNNNEISDIDGHNSSFSQTIVDDTIGINISITTSNASNQPLVQPHADTNSIPLPTTPTARGRLVFLDHVKIFLTFMVVTFHVTCAFGACQETWFLIVGNTGTPLFDFLNVSFAMLNQAYFMPLFFFISAYLVPPSYETVKRQDNNLRIFFAKKSKRLYLPAMGTTLLIIPATWALSQYVRGKAIYYFPWPSHCWYLFWLLLLIWVYHSLQQALSPESMPSSLSESEVSVVQGGTRELIMSPVYDTEQATTSPCHEIGTSTDRQHHKRRKSFPKTWKRLLYGSVVCGSLTLGMYVLSFGARTWALVPASIGGIPCDIFMFCMGIVARNNGWLEASHDNNTKNKVIENAKDDGNRSQSLSQEGICLKSQMDISPTLQRSMVLIEIVAMVAIFSLDLENAPIWQPVLAFLIAGIYCVDMGLAVVQAFQEYSILCTENKWTRYLSKAAYTVYLIHPTIIVAMTSLYIWGYNRLVGETSSNRIVFVPHEEEGRGGGEFFWLGWILVAITSHLVVWPLSWFLANLPVLRGVL